MKIRYKSMLNYPQDVENENTLIFEIIFPSCSYSYIEMMDEKIYPYLDTGRRSEPCSPSMERGSYPHYYK